MNSAPLPPAPAHQSKKERTKEKKAQRKAANTPLPDPTGDEINWDDDGNIISITEEAPGSPDQVPALTTADAPGVTPTEGADGTVMDLVLRPKSPDETSTALVGPRSNSAEPSSGFEGDVPPNTTQDTDMVDRPQGPSNYAFLDESLPLEERVRAFNQIEEERARLVSAWHKDKKACEECGKTHAPPHFNKEEQIADSKAFKKGRQLRQELKNAPKKGKAVFCKTCKKYHPGGAQGCTTPLCPKGCNLHHAPREPCADAATRFEKVEEARWSKGKGKGKGKAPAAAPAPAPGPGLDAMLTDVYQKLRNAANVMGNAADLLGTLGGEKRPAEESPEKAGSSKKQKKGGNSCQPPQQPSKGPNKPNGKGKGKGKGKLTQA